MNWTRDGAVVERVKTLRIKTILLLAPFRITPLNSVLRSHTAPLTHRSAHTPLGSHTALLRSHTAPLPHRSAHILWLVVMLGPYGF